MNSINKVVEKFDIKYPERDESKVKEAKTLNVPIPFSIASSWLLDKPLSKVSKVTMDLEIIDPKSKSIAKQSQELKGFPEGVDRLNININMGEVVITSSGRYRIIGDLKIDDKVVASTDYPYEISFEAQKAG